LDDTSVADADDAVAALSALDAALDTVNSARATIGAGMNRLESALRTGETTVAEGTAAASRIVDLDVAQAATDLARAGILEQVRVSMLAQARQIERDSVLGLLSG
jgi:flagellin